MKTAVVYRSKSGYVERYAKWIQAALKADIFRGEAVRAQDLMGYDTIIYGGGLYAVGINGFKLITGNFDQLKDKNLILFATGASTERADILEEVLSKNTTPEQRDKIKSFYLRGGFEFSRLGAVDKMLMLLMKRNLLSKRRKGPLTPDERGMLAAYDTPVDFTRERNIEPLLEYVRSLDEVKQKS